jgi:hypothetical protein
LNRTSGNRLIVTKHRDQTRKSPPPISATSFLSHQVEARGFEPHVALYLLPYRASV